MQKNYELWCFLKKKKKKRTYFTYAEDFIYHSTTTKNITHLTLPVPKNEKDLHLWFVYKNI